MGDDRPLGALILATQAIEHAFGAWLSGAFVKQTGSAAHFSGAKYGDIFERNTTANSKGQPTMKLNNQATQYIPTMKNFKDTTWDDIYLAVEVFLEERKSKKKKKKAAEFDSTMEVVVAENNYVLVSDED